MKRFYFILLGVFLTGISNLAYGSDDNLILIPLESEGATVSSGVSGVCAGCAVTNDQAVIGENLSLHATVTMPLGLTGSAYLHVTFPYEQEAGLNAGFVIGSLSGLADATLLGALQLTTYLNGEEQETISDPNQLDLVILGAGTQRAVSFTTQESFDAVRISFEPLVALLSETAIYHAFSSDGEFTVSMENDGLVTDYRLAIYPNPIVGVGTVELALPAGYQLSAVTLYDLLGRALHDLPANGESGSVAFQLNTSGLSAGVYVLVIHSSTPEGTIHRMSQRFTVVGLP